ncbi:MAG: 30S ribosomal protein S12 methylthiotransferase RimO [Spirochaetaceae bacterium]|nr:30S ribosomal protein S12 methylthiotransferase RimO [Spirochaetaceae bacterium]
MKFYIEPLGCVKNQVDAETIISNLNAAGAELSENPDEADLVIVNSCGFIEEAKQESINTVIGFRRDYPDKKIILSGCLAQRYQEELRRELIEADAVFGNSRLDDITALAFSVTGAERGISRRAETERIKLLSLPGSAYVKIAEGCDNRCSFCAIPLIRGGLVSRSIDDIVSECRGLLKRGVRELCLVAQDLASYGAGTSESLPGLLSALSALDSDFWVRLLYLHPDHFPFKILETIASDKRFLPYFDIPFQHASPSLLRAMNRRGGAEEYLDLIARIRAAVPDSVIRSTFLTGFPGETYTDFDILLDFQDAARMDWLGVFVFSREDGVPAYSFKNRVSKKTARERKTILETRQTPITETRMDRFIGRRMRALVEEKLDAFYLGRLFCQAPEVDGALVIESAHPLQLGAFVDGIITGRAGFDLRMLPAPTSGFTYAPR